jgi:hypothetical protein
MYIKQEALGVKYKPKEMLCIDCVTEAKGISYTYQYKKKNHIRINMCLKTFIQEIITGSVHLQ